MTEKVYEAEKVSSIFYKNTEIPLAYPLSEGYWQPMLRLPEVLRAIETKEGTFMQWRHEPLSRSFYKAPGSKARWISVSALLNYTKYRDNDMGEWVYDNFRVYCCHTPVERSNCDLIGLMDAILHNPLYKGKIPWEEIQPYFKMLQEYKNRTLRVISECDSLRPHYAF